MISNHDLFPNVSNLKNKHSILLFWLIEFVSLGDVFTNVPQIFLKAGLLESSEHKSKHTLMYNISVLRNYI